MTLGGTKKVKIVFSVLAGIVLLGALGYLYFNGKLFSSADSDIPPGEEPFVITVVDKLNKPVPGRYVLISVKNGGTRSVYNNYTDSRGQLSVQKSLLNPSDHFVAAVFGQNGENCIVYKDINVDLSGLKITVDDANCPSPPTLEVTVRTTSGAGG